MKHVLKIAVVAAGIFSFSQSQAAPVKQDTTVGHKINKTAKKVGDATSHAAASSASAIVDKK